MIKLVYSPRSPYARKVMVAAIELGLDKQLELISEKVGIGVKNEPYTSAINPLGKVPALILEDGTSLSDSAVIVEYLDDLAGGGRLIPSGPARWRVLSEHSIVQGMTDSIVSARRERSARPSEFYWKVWDDDQMGRIWQALGWFEARPQSLAGPLNIAQIGLVCGIGYMDFRMPENPWRGEFPKVTAFYAEQEERPSFVATKPPA
jgi:glutathione S-transferase